MNILDLVFPKKCLNCGREGKYICLPCLSQVGLPKTICYICGRPSIDGFTHLKCKKKRSMDRLIAIYRYEGVIRKAILSLKYKFALEIAAELAFSAVTAIESGKLKINNLVPIPLHWYRENWRGFNQAEEVGKLIAREMNWKFLPDLLIRKKSTIPQAELDRKDRLQNVKNIFSLNPNYKQSVINDRLILFDDVWTTGSTIREAVKVLKRSGAKEVWGLTLAG